ncbi:MAG: FAD-dependent monooxygenase [Enterovibrio sp.]
MKIINADVVILGAGMVGLTLAAALAESSLQVVVIEPQLHSPLAPDAPPDIHVCAINRASERILTRVGAWQNLPAQRLASFAQIHVWEQDSFAQIDFHAQAIGESNLGYVVENTVLKQALLEKLANFANVRLLCPDAAQDLLVREHEAWLTLNSGATLCAKLVVGADGANSWLRKQAQIPLTQWDLEQKALIATVQTQQPHYNIARQIFTPRGPLAFLPLADSHLCSIVWSLPHAQADQLLQMDAADFNKALTVAFDTRLGVCQLHSQPASVALKMRYAQQFVAPRIALIGDAAHTIHPLAGQGVNLGLQDAAALAQELLRLHAQHKDFGAKTSLRYFERWRKTQSAQMIAAMQGFHLLFQGDSAGKKLLRGVGLLATDKLPFVKEKLMQQALGLCGELPLLAQDEHVSSTLV